jgi:hypothetical protein
LPKLNNQSELNMKNTEANATIARLCAQNALEAGRAIRNAIYSMSLEERSKTQQSVLKASSRSRTADARGETIGTKYLERLCDITGYRIQLVVSPSESRAIGKSERPENIFVYLDAVDGTYKVAGLGGPKYQANDGNWGIGFAFTNPTIKRLEDLELGDFVSAAIVSGNPRTLECAPQEVYAISTADERAAYDSSGRRVFTSSQKNLSQTFVHLDSFQAFDRETAAPQTEALAVELYAQLINRNKDGAFDVLRTYGNLSAFVTAMLGWRDAQLPESQGGAFIALNENPWNMIPCMIINEAAGGISTDLGGKSLADRTLKDSRTHVMHAANQELHKKVMQCVLQAQNRLYQ